MHPASPVDPLSRQLRALREGSAGLAADLARRGVMSADAQAALLVYAARALLLGHMQREAGPLTVRSGFTRDDLAVLVHAPGFTLVQPVTPVARGVALQDDHPTPAFFEWSRAHRGEPDLATARLHAQADAHVQARGVALLVLTYARACTEGVPAGQALLQAREVAWRWTGTRPEPSWSLLRAAQG